MMQRVIAIILLISVFNASCNSGSGKRNADKTAEFSDRSRRFFISNKSCGR
jgi:thioredoxin-related protein